MTIGLDACIITYLWSNSINFANRKTNMIIHPNLPICVNLYEYKNRRVVSTWLNSLTESIDSMHKMDGRGGNQENNMSCSISSEAEKPLVSGSPPSSSSSSSSSSSLFNAEVKGSDFLRAPAPLLRVSANIFNLISTVATKNCYDD